MYAARRSWGVFALAYPLGLGVVGAAVAALLLSFGLDNLQRMVEVSGQSLTPTLEYGEFVVADFSLDELHDALKHVPEIKKEFGLGAGEE